MGIYKTFHGFLQKKKYVEINLKDEITVNGDFANYLQ